MLKKYFLFILIIFTILLSGCGNHSANRKNLQTQNQKTNQPVKTVEKKLSEPVSSGQIQEVPWENNPEFIAARKQSAANKLMAAYCTVLKDPLPGEENNVHLGADYLAGTVVKPGAVFSQNQSIGPYSQSRGFQKGPVYIGSQLKTTIGGGVCKIASTLYNAAVLSDLPIIERHAHGMPVPYVPYGQDATVSYGFKDIKFENIYSFPILIWAQGIDNKLYMGFYGQKDIPQVKWHHQFLKKYKSQNIYLENPALTEGTEKVVLPGMDGAVVKSWVTVVMPDGSTKTKNLGISYYKPMPAIIEKHNSP